MAAFDLPEIVEARHQNASTIFISQCGAAGWHEHVDDGRVADAIPDRIIHNAYEIVIDGEDSMRWRKKAVNCTFQRQHYLLPYLV